MLGSELQEPVPDEPQSPPGVFGVGKISQMAAELASQRSVELVQQVVLGFEVSKQRSLGDACRPGDGRGRRASDSTFGADLQSRIENCCLLVTTSGSRQPDTPGLRLIG